MKKEEKLKAIALRRQGKTYGEILKVIPVAKSTLSLWLREVGLVKKQKQLITQKKIDARAKGARARRTQRLESTKMVFEKAESEIGHISPRELWLMGTMLYWAEGSKEKEWSHGQGIRFINSDPQMIKMFLNWLFLVFPITVDDISLAISIHQNSANTIDGVKEFWSKVTGFSLDKLATIQYKKHNPKPIRKNIGNMYNGCLSIRVRKSTTMLRQIAGWTHGVSKQYCGIV